MKKILFAVLMLINISAFAKETTWECNEYTAAEISMSAGISKNDKVVDAKTKIVINDEGYYIPAGAVFAKERYYFWLDPNDPEGKAVSANRAIAKDQNRFIIYIFRNMFTGKKGEGNDVTGYIALMNCSIIS